MKVQYGTTWLASGGMEGARDFKIDGFQVNEVADIFRASNAVQFPRYTRSANVTFSVTKLFNSESDLLAFLSTCLAGLASSAVLSIFDETGVSAAYMAGALVESVRPQAAVGVSLVVDYAFTGGLFTSQQVTVPNESDLVKRDSLALTAGDTSKAVTFTVAFGQPPGAVTVSIAQPAGGYVICSTVDKSTVSAAGFTADCGAAIPAAGYYLNWEAVA